MDCSRAASNRSKAPVQITCRRAALGHLPGTALVHQHLLLGAGLGRLAVASRSLTDGAWLL